MPRHVVAPHPTQCRERRELFPKAERWLTLGSSTAEKEWMQRGESRPAGDERELSGWCYKRHARAPSSSPETRQWGRRYVKVDDRRGTIGYAHWEDGQPSSVLALQDVTAVRALPGSSATSHPGFEVCAPPLSLKIRIVGPDDEQSAWIGSLERRVQHWRLKAAAEGPMRAMPNLDAEADDAVEGPWKVQAGRGMGMRAVW